MTNAVLCANICHGAQPASCEKGGGASWAVERPSLAQDCCLRGWYFPYPIAILLPGRSSSSCCPRGVGCSDMVTYKHFCITKNFLMQLLIHFTKHQASQHRSSDRCCQTTVTSCHLRLFAVIAFLIPILFSLVSLVASLTGHWLNSFLSPIPQSWSGLDTWCLYTIPPQSHWEHNPKMS